MLDAASKAASLFHNLEDRVLVLALNVASGDAETPMEWTVTFGAP